MNSRRACSSCASRWRMRSNARASWPSSSVAVVDDRLVEVAGGDPLRGALEAADAAREHPRRRVADEQRPAPGRARRRAGACARRGRRSGPRRASGARDEHDAVRVDDRHRDLGEPLVPSPHACPRCASSVARGGKRRPGRSRAVVEVCRRRARDDAQRSAGFSVKTCSTATRAPELRSCALDAFSSRRIGSFSQPGRQARRDAALASAFRSSTSRCSSEGTTTGRRSPSAPATTRRSARLERAADARAEPAHRLPEAVADAAHGEDQLGLARVALELLAQVADVDVDRARLAVVGVAPERLEQHPAAVDTRPGAQPACAAARTRRTSAATAFPPTSTVRRRGRSRAPSASSTSLRRACRAAAVAARRSSARTRLRNSRIENGFVM